jgi:hypothetical protein
MNNENLKAYYELQERLKQYEKEDREKKRLKAKTLRLLRKKRKLERQLKATEKEYVDLLYNDKVFSYFERRRFLEKHNKEGD